MTMKRTVVLLLILLLSLCSITYAINNFDVEYKTINNFITIGEKAWFNVTIRNKREYAEHFELYSPETDWSVSADPAFDNKVNLPPYSQKKILVSVEAKDVKAAGDYGIQLNVKSNNGNELQAAFLPILLRSPEQVHKEYQAVIRTSIDIPKRIDPRNKLEIKVSVENRNLRDIEELNVRVTSDLLSLESNAGLGPLKEKTLVFAQDIDPYISPRKENIVITVSMDGKQLTRNFETVEIIGYSILKQDIKIKKGFFTTTTIIDLMNDGNIPIKRPYFIETTNFKSWFTKTSGSLKREIVDSDYLLVSELSLNPKESSVLVYVEDYRPIVYVVVLFIVIIVLYFVLRSPVLVVKAISSVKSKEGAISEIKVLLMIKNRTALQFDDLVVLDRAPHITQLVNEFTVGLVKPSKILSNDVKGTIIKWNLDNIEGYEERVLSYKIRTRMDILGGLNLPVAIVKYKSRNGREFSIKSNRLKLILDDNISSKKKED